MLRVGFIGLGNIGEGVAANIQRGGYPLTVLDMRAERVAPFVERGAIEAGTARDLAAQSDVIFTSLPGPAEVEHVVRGKGGLLEGLRPGSIYVDLSTNRPSLIRELAAEVSKAGAAMMDAPVSGGKAGAASRNLAVMVGGDEDAYQRVLPVLNAFGDKIFYAGGIGNGSICKLVHNLIAQNFRQIVAEGLTLGAKAGVDVDVLWNALRRGAVGRARFVHETLVKTIFLEKFEPANFSLGLAKKDVLLAIELASEMDVPMPVTNLVHQFFIQGMNRGWEHKDSNILFTLQEEAAGVKARTDRIDPVAAAKAISMHID